MKPNSAILNNKHLCDIRLFEANFVLSFFPKEAEVLEIGAGNGWQARFFSEHGLNITAIDIGASDSVVNTVYPIYTYDGTTLPFDDYSFDVVYSSNVLEHVSDLKHMNTEIYRVLRTGGKAIHILPSSSWRIWTNITHYIWCMKQLLAYVQGKNLQYPYGIESVTKKAQKRNLLQLIKAGIFPPAHGERGNFITEIYYYSRPYIKKECIKSNFNISGSFACNIFYSGYCLLGTRINVAHRQLLSRLFGSSTIVYIFIK